MVVLSPTQISLSPDTSNCGKSFFFIVTYSDVPTQLLWSVPVTLNEISPWMVGVIIAPVSFVFHKYVPSFPAPEAVNLAISPSQISLFSTAIVMVGFSATST